MATTTLTSPPSSASLPSPRTGDQPPTEEDLCRDWAQYVRGIARKYSADPATESDALLGLVLAARSWDPSKSNFRTYLNHRIPGAIIDGFRDRDHLSRSLRKKLKDADGTDARLRYPASLNHLQEEIGFDAPDTAQDVFQEIREEALLSRRVEALFAYASMALDWRHYQALHLYYREGIPLWQIGEQLGVTESRVSQMMKKSEDTLKRQLAQAVM